MLGASLEPREPWPILASRISVILEADGTQKLQGCTLPLSKDATCLGLGLLLRLLGTLALTINLGVPHIGENPELLAHEQSNTLNPG